ncbi:prohibitin-like protein, putative [Plasmodium knowlesi strain H]|uniref:Prohibitin-like protein, putative n=3 Tax=Plasmodium knowlesi TaxID=5850 RepID=A0A5K1UJD0_PLAKH|nr:prohibitin-like protein PHBL, putative [Plasmodium knowlesi strain H]OTN67907.1 putative Prohibitin-like protein [Plasmodium knowlesi]CAA9986977.1 prohibitin-like protein PHBL, putative [Plasmodium knowlesi strain H]SBO26608.1 prohibitin-like protein, putative [Plasmodium knowlesi strain H]SBO28183.1 prohibitin-like protein, putative [Plasmodium knowlesi strain H]VVS76451.1 prohibitin-like protein PHBL, putative [Plasmodium knowlesi strain H]|eukprot:XP_002258222.1 prohibitin-like protein, putative [Plasmodium knowlesi strain H]
MKGNFLLFKNYAKWYKRGSHQLCVKWYAHNVAELVNTKKKGGEMNKHFSAGPIKDGINKYASEAPARVSFPNADFSPNLSHHNYDNDGDVALTRNAEGPVYENERKPKDEIKLRCAKSLKLLSMCIITSLFFYCTFKKVPEGYICLVQNKSDNTVLPYIYDDLMTFFFNPLKYKVHIIRVIPIQKKFTRVYETLDKKKVRVKLQVKMKPKIPFIIEIFSSFGDNYSTNYIEKEMNLDIMNVVKNYDLDTLVEENKEANGTPHVTVDDAVDQIMDRFYDCSVFHKIILLDVSILFERVE